MRIIPVLDVRTGQAVRAVAGNRAHYGPLASVLHPGTDPVDLARFARDVWGLPDLYLADLDAILGEASADCGLYRRIADLGLNLWADAGVRGASDVAPLIEAGVGRVVVGLETIRGPDALAGVVAEAGPDRVVFSVDHRRGRPLIDAGPDWGTNHLGPIVAKAIEAGVRRFIDLDLERVGTGRGVEPIEGFRTDGLEWTVGGGIAGIEQVRELHGRGFDGVLVGSALHDGRITTSELRDPPLPIIDRRTS